jgi:hypothetical protein
VPVTRLRSQLRTRGAVRAGGSAAGIAVAMIVLAVAGTGLGGSATAAVLMLVVALAGGLAWHRGERDGLRARLADAQDLPAGVAPQEQSLDRTIMLVYATGILVVTVALGLAFGDAVYAALAVIAVTQGFTFADLLAAREVEMVEQAGSVVVYTPQVGGAPKRQGRRGPPLYVLKRSRSA